MGSRHVHLVWSRASLTGGRLRLGLLGFLPRTPGQDRATLVICVHGLLIWIAALGALGYVAGSISLFWLWSGRPYSQLTYADAALYPWRRESVRRKQGQASLAAGFDALRERRLPEAATLLRIGLTHAPDDLPARRALARIHVAAGQRLSAQAILAGGLGPASPGQAYLNELFRLAEEGEDFGAVAATCARYRPALARTASPAERIWLLARQSNALLADGRAREALALAETEPPSDLANEIRVRALMALGPPERPFEVLDRWNAASDASRYLVLRLRVAALRSAGRLDEMETALKNMRELAPSDARTAAYGVVQFSLAGRTDRARAAFDDYLLRFGGSSDNLILLAEALADSGEGRLVEECTTAAAERGYDLTAFRLATLAVQVKAGAWLEAATSVRTLRATLPTAAPSTPWVELMERLIEVAATGSPTAIQSLLETLRARPWPIQHFKRVAESLRQAQRQGVAQQVIELAAGLFPASRWVAGQRSIAP